MFVGTGAEISAITTYPGQEAFCTSTGSGFTVDTYYIRNAANTAWITSTSIDTVMTETSELSSTPVTDNADFTVTAGNRYYAFLTMPSDYLLYEITAIEWKNGATIAGSVTAGVDIVDADPPTNAHTPLAALCTKVNQGTINVVNKNSFISPCMVRAGTILGIWVSCSSGSAVLREQTGLGSQNQYKATSYTNTPSAAEATAWSTATARKYLKLYYRGYN